MATADVTDLLVFRATLNADEDFAKVSVNHLLLAALSRALSQTSPFNAVWTEDGILTDILDQLDRDYCMGLVDPDRMIGLWMSGVPEELSNRRRMWKGMASRRALAL